MADAGRGSAAQVIGSLLVALMIVAVTITLVTARIGPDSGDDTREEQRERAEERLDEQRDAQDEQREDIEDAREGEDSSGRHSTLATDAIEPTRRAAAQATTAASTQVAWASACWTSRSSARSI